MKQELDKVLKTPIERTGQAGVFEPEVRQADRIAWSEKTYESIQSLARTARQSLAQCETSLEPARKEERIPEQAVVWCEKCSKEYVLLENAIVTTWERTAAQFKFGTGLGGISPDLIDSAEREAIDRNYSTQVEEVARIRNSIKQRSWTSRACNSTYNYTQTIRGR